MNDYWDGKGNTYEILYDYYKPEGWVADTEYYSTTYDSKYKDGYGYNFYFMKGGYYEYYYDEYMIQGPPDVGSDMAVIIGALVGACIFICLCSKFIHWAIQKKKKDFKPKPPTKSEIIRKEELDAALDKVRNKADNVQTETQ